MHFYHGIKVILVFSEIIVNDANLPPQYLQFQMILSSFGTGDLHFLIYDCEKNYIDNFFFIFYISLPIRDETNLSFAHEFLAYVLK